MNSVVGVRVPGRRLEDLVRVSESVVAVLRLAPRAAEVFADSVRGSG